MSKVYGMRGGSRSSPCRRTAVAGAAIAWLLLLGSCGDAAEAPFGASSSTTAGQGGVATTAVTSTVGAATSTTAPDQSGASDTTLGETTPPDTSPPAELQGLDVEVIATGLHQPTVVTAPPGDPRVFAVERSGSIRIVDPDEGLIEESFLNLRDRVGANGIEQGLLGLAFHRDYATNGRLFVYYTDTSGNRQLSEFTVSDDPNRADPDSERVLFELPQPPGSTDIRHYAGAVEFGPDGYLYVSLGDGADSKNQGQNPDTMYASIVRLDVDNGDPYGIPAENPFVTEGGAAEVWAYGLRNPWRFSIDPVERLLYVADVGQSGWEEVDVVSIEEGGYNFGWPLTEGNHCFSPSDCDMTGLTLPVFEYGHDDGCSITGGFVYRGAAIPELTGHYFYGDWCGLWVRSFRYDGTAVTDQQDWSEDLAAAGQVNSFGTDGAGELYIANFEGTVMRVVPIR